MWREKERGRRACEFLALCVWFWETYSGILGDGAKFMRRGQRNLGVMAVFGKAC